MIVVVVVVVPRSGFFGQLTRPLFLAGEGYTYHPRHCLGQAVDNRCRLDWLRLQ